VVKQFPISENNFSNMTHNTKLEVVERLAATGVLSSGLLRSRSFIPAVRICIISSLSRYWRYHCLYSEYTHHCIKVETVRSRS